MSSGNESPEEDPIKLLGALADELRLRAFAALILGARDANEIAERAGVPARDALRALARLEAAGLATNMGDHWQGRPEALRETVAAVRERPAPLDYSEAGTSEAAVLRTFMPNGRLNQIPVQKSKRMIVLNHIAGVFEPGRRYPEAEVNTLLRAFHDDYATLRRYLVDGGFMTRESGEYWRTGGTVVI